MRPWAPLALLALLLAAPLAAGQSDAFTLRPGTYRAFAIDAAEGDRYEIDLTSDMAVDVLLVNGTDDAYVAGTGGTQRPLEMLNVTAAAQRGKFPFAGRWTLIVDNSDAPAGGANGTTNATIALRLVIAHRIVTPPVIPPAAPSEDENSRNPWPVLMLTSPAWDLGLVGLGGMTLWFLVLAALAAVGYREGWEKIGVLVAGVTLLVALWSFIPSRGPVAHIGLPLLIASGVAWLADRGSSDGRQGMRMAFLAGGFGAILGVTLGHLLAAIWSDPGMLIVGADRFDDPVFIVPVAAAALAFLIAAIVAFVEASEDEETVAVPDAPGVGASFTVACLRCHTPIKVDRSMKRYRVATDRYEFACPNCHAWMEWAEPKAAAAA